MTRIQILSLAAAALCSFGVLAWQEGVASTGWTDADAPAIAKAFLIDTSPGRLPGGYLIKPAARKPLQMMGGPARARVVQELARYARSYVSTPTFAKLYDQWLAQRYQAVNHGIKTAQAAEMAALTSAGAIENMMAQAAAQTAQSYARMQPAALKVVFSNDLKNWSRNPKDPKAKRLAAKAQEIAPLLDSNPLEFRKQYALLKSIEMGGPDTWQGVEAAAAAASKTQADNKAKQEQRAYDEHQLKVELKRRLQAFVTLARSVDFAAQTRELAGRRVFVNEAYEGKSESWKMLFRLGKEPTLAAVSAAEAWLREL